MERFLKEGARYVNFDAELGWTNSLETNSAGMRDDREYDALPPLGVVRIAAFGDSFVRGNDVELGETWGKQLVGMAPALEFLNYGGSGYGLDQSYLRYLRVAAQYRPNIVFIGFMSENILRGVNDYRLFYSDPNDIFTKPRFTVKNGQLILMKNPLACREDYHELLRDDRRVLARLGENDYHYQTNPNAGPLDFSPAIRLTKSFRSMVDKKLVYPIFRFSGTYNVNSEAYEITIRTFDAFYRAVLRNGSLPVIIIFPDADDHPRSREGKVRRYAPLLADFRARGYRCLDLLDAIEPYQSRYTIDELTKNWGHFSPLASQIAARYILDQLRASGLLTPTGVNEAIERERLRLGARD